MSQYEKLSAALMSGTKDGNFLFSDLQMILARIGFQCRINGDHFIYTRDGIDEIINIQPVGNKAKPYQVKQVRHLVLVSLGGVLNEV
jgi:hypothetical protein